VGEGKHCRAGDDVSVALDILRGDLESVEKETGAAGIELGAGKAVEDLGECNLDGAAIFENREFDGLLFALGFFGGEAVQAGVEVAVGRATKER
jgi:hypothetical protein